MASPHVAAVHRSSGHSLSKFAEESITLVEGLGVQGDAHAGEKVKHRSRAAKNPNQPNLRQIHLIHAELFDELMARDHPVFPGELGENIPTRGIDLLALPTGTRLHIGNGGAVVQVTGLRNPCSQIDRFQKGLMHAVLDKDMQGNLVRKAGVMGVVLAGGEVRTGDALRVELPVGERRLLQPV